MIENGTHFNPFGQRKGSAEPTLTLKDILDILNRQRLPIILCTLLFTILAGIYAFLAAPVYRTTTVLKKEVNIPKNNQYLDEFSRIVSMQTVNDEIETEAELIRSRVVLEKVIQDLDLYFILGRIEVPDVVAYSFDLPLEAYRYELEKYPDSGAPRVEIQEFTAPPGFRELAPVSYVIRVNEYRGLELYVEETEELLETRAIDSGALFTLPMFKFSVNWPNPVPGSALYFTVANHEDTYQSLRQSIEVSTPINTTLLSISVKAPSSYMTYRLANSIANTFRETRFEHKRETIRYSAGFVDDQLNEISEKLTTAEEALSAFRGQNQLTNIDESTRSTLEFMSQLESERITTDLQLTEYNTRLVNLKTQLSEKGYFDQTYLTPRQESSNNTTPFTTLLQQLSNAELERLELLQRRTDSHPDVIAVNDRIEEIKESLTEYNRNTIDSYEIIIRSLEQKRSDLQSLINQYSRKARSMAENEGELMKLTRERDMYQKVYVLLSNKREEMRIAELSNIQDIILIEAAVMPLEPILPKKKIYVLIGMILGLMGGVTVGLFREFSSKMVTRLSDVETDLMLPILAIMPTYPSQIKDRIRKQYSIQQHLELLTDTRHGFKESYRILRTKLSFILSTKRNPGKNNILFTSCEENTGKTTIVTNFSLLLALAGKRILIIDCDLKNPSVGRFFNIPFNAPGLIDFLSFDYVTSPDIYTPLDDPAFRDNSLFNPTLRMEHEELSLNNQKYELDVIPAGGSIEHSSELLASDKFKDYLSEISGAYDYILIDTPPVTRTVDALTIGNYVKNGILVVRPNHSRRDNLQRAIQDFRQFNVHLLGSVVNACDIKRFATDYGYGYGYGYTYEYDAAQAQLPETTSVN